MKKQTSQQINKNNPYHYVYKITHLKTGEFYIGARSSKIPFEAAKHDVQRMSNIYWQKIFGLNSNNITEILID